MPKLEGERERTEERKRKERRGERDDVERGSRQERGRERERENLRGEGSYGEEQRLQRGRVGRGRRLAGDAKAQTANSADGGSRATKRPRTTVPATGGGAIVGMMTSGSAAVGNSGHDGGTLAIEGGAQIAAPGEIGSGPVDDLEQRRGGALQDLSIPNETQQQWTMRHVFNEARRRDGRIDMSSYLDAVDISQLSVRWGHLSGYFKIVVYMSYWRYLLGLAILVFDGVQTHSLERGKLYSSEISFEDTGYR
ncbi:hypothetical protein Syun_010218 [Stephania yunnanensis]|uniref:Uncharacterized protein n=1 Tax=Stephania yunnanensis TaxID=152371 RepID=A0AAP0KHY0_9MAGN